jgi:hypothetical protein
MTLLLAALGWLKLWPWQLWLTVLLGLAILGGLAYEHHQGFSAGSAQTLQKIEDANHVEQQKADRSAETVDDCYRLGGDWDRATGVCHVGAGH